MPRVSGWVDQWEVFYEHCFGFWFCFGKLRDFGSLWEGMGFLLGEWNPTKRSLKVLTHSILLIFCANEFSEFLCMNILSWINEQLNSVDDEPFMMNELLNLAYDHLNYIWVLWK